MYISKKKKKKKKGYNENIKILNGHQNIIRN